VRRGAPALVLTGEPAAPEGVPGIAGARAE